jgi:hypothetical protein
MHRRSFAAAMLVGFAALTGCGPRWRVITQATPDPFVNQRHFAVLPIDYTGLRVSGQSEPHYLSDMDPEERYTFQSDKVAVNEAFEKALTERAAEDDIEITASAEPTSAPFLIRPYVSFMEPGFYAVVTMASSEIKMTVRIMTPEGKILDEVSLSHKTPPPNPSTMDASINADKKSPGGRWREDGRALGVLVAEYLTTRVNP